MTNFAVCELRQQNDSHCNPEQGAKKASGVSPRNQRGKNIKLFHRKIPDFMEDTFLLDKRNSAIVLNYFWFFSWI